MNENPGRRIRAFGLAVALVAALAIPAAALAATGGGDTIQPRMAGPVVVDVEGVTLNDKLLATIQFRLTCNEITYYDWELGQDVTTTEGRLFASGQLIQAQGRSIASASGFGARTDVTCDGSTVNHLAVQVIAGNLPLRRGAALIGVTADVGAGDGEEFGASGPTELRLR